MFHVKHSVAFRSAQFAPIRRIVGSCQKLAGTHPETTPVAVSAKEKGAGFGAFRKCCEESIATLDALRPDDTARRPRWQW